MLPSYVVSSLEGRARLRHPLLRSEEGAARVTAVLRKDGRIYEIVRGSGSLLLFFDPSLSIGTICAALEREIPEFTQAAKKVSSGSWFWDLLGNCFGVRFRRLELGAMLLSLGASVLSIALGLNTPHLLLSALFVLLTARHVWVRRTAL